MSDSAAPGIAPVDVVTADESTEDGSDVLRDVGVPLTSVYIVDWTAVLPEQGESRDGVGGNVHSVQFDLKIGGVEADESNLLQGFLHAGIVQGGLDPLTRRAFGNDEPQEQTFASLFGHFALALELGAQGRDGPIHVHHGDFADLGLGDWFGDGARAWEFLGRWIGQRRLGGVLPGTGAVTEP